MGSCPDFKILFDLGHPSVPSIQEFPAPSRWWGTPSGPNAAEWNRTYVGTRCQYSVELGDKNVEGYECECHEDEISKPIASRPKIRQMRRIGLCTKSAIDRSEGNDTNNTDDYYNSSL